MINPFSTISTYSEMLKKIAWYTFFASLISILILNHYIVDLSQLTNKLPLNVELLGAKLPILMVIPAFLIALIFSIVKMHDKISDLVGIRRNFDVHWILKPMALDCGFRIEQEQIEKLKKKRRDIIGDVFYKYATSDLDQAKIDKHAIAMALNQWSWFWILVESSFVAFIGVAALAIYDQFKPILWFFVAILVMIGLMTLSRQSSKRYAKDQIKLILQDPMRKQEVKAAFNALFG